MPLTVLCSGVEDIKWYYTHREANDFAECVKRMSGKSPCGAANAGLCLMTLGVRSTTKRKSCPARRCERNS